MAGERGHQVQWLSGRVRVGVVGRSDDRRTHDLFVPEVHVINQELT